MRTKAQSFPTAVVGDVSTCKVNRGVKQKTQSAYNWCAEIPGDMHAKGFLCEAAFKAHSKSVFHKIVNTVMKLPKLTEEAFGKRKFQEQRGSAGWKLFLWSCGCQGVQEIEFSPNTV